MNRIAELRKKMGLTQMRLGEVLASGDFRHSESD